MSKATNLELEIMLAMGEQSGNRFMRAILEDISQGRITIETAFEMLRDNENMVNEDLKEMREKERVLTNERG